MKKNKRVFVDIDTQFDFMHPEGNLSVSGAQDIVPQLETLIRFAKKNNIPIVASVDAHLPKDKEFALFPPHCLKGTAGQKKIDATHFEGALIIENKPQTLHLENVQAVVLEKDVFDVFDNIHTETVLKSLNADEYVVFGVATDYCVKAAVLGLRERGYAVALVTDAIKAVTAEGEKTALEEMRQAGAQFVTTAEVVGP